MLNLPHLSKISPQRWVFPVPQLNALQATPPSVMPESGMTKMGASAGDGNPASFTGTGAIPSTGMPTLSTLQPAVHNKTETAHP